jgi:tetratricopeptide (TPR) repeat protein
MEQAEILMYLGAFYYEQGLHEKAKSLLLSAQKIYEYQNDLHRKGIAEWILHVANHHQGAYNQSYKWANQTRKGFHYLEQFSARNKLTNHEHWYRDRVQELTMELAAIPNYVYEWMFEFSGSCLKPAALQVRDRIRQLLNLRHSASGAVDAEEVIGLVKLLLSLTKTSLDTAETAEALVISGLAAYDLGDQKEAVWYFRSALTKFVPGSHQHTLARWMLSLTLFTMPEELHRAVQNMEMCLVSMAELRQKADQQQKPAACQWYEIHGEAMKRYLKRGLANNI